MKRVGLAGVMFVGCLATPVAAQVSATPEERLAAAGQALRTLAPSVVRVEYTLRCDEGQIPEARTSWGEVDWWQDFPGDYIAQQRPLVAPGFLLAPDLVITPDAALAPRFVESCTVYSGEGSSPARVTAYARDRQALYLQLEQTLASAAPLAFGADADKAPAFCLTAASTGGRWQLDIVPAFSGLYLEDGQVLAHAPDAAVVAGRDGSPLGLVMSKEVTEDSWRGDPARWPQISAAEWEERQGALRGIVAAGLPRVELRFRSPKRGGDSALSFMWRDDESEDLTQLDVVGLLYDDTHVLIVAPLARKTLARLDQVLVHTPEGGPVTARFVGALRDYEALVAELEKPLQGAIRLHAGPVQALRCRFLAAAQVRQYGTQRQVHLEHARLNGFDAGRGGRLFPTLDNPTDLFVFTPEGELVALPMRHRQPVSLEGDWTFDSEAIVSMPSGYVARALADLSGNVDPSNVPRGEDQEGRLAWLGVEVQSLDAELARMQGVAHLTQDGESGAVVSFVYPNSPAAEAGLQPGDVLLRLYVPGEPRPIEVDGGIESGGGFAIDWEEVESSEIPMELWNEAPTPWPSAASNLNTVLTRLGVGRKYEVEFFRKGETQRQPLAVTEGPPHYEAAPQFKSKPLGLTVRDLTFEVRRHFQKGAEDPGVIVARLEPGERAAIAGLRPFEIITRVNDAPVASAAEFGKLTAHVDVLRLTVQRMAQSRVVRIDLTAPLPEAGDEGLGQEREIPPGE